MKMIIRIINDDHDQGRGGGGVSSTWFTASFIFSERQVHPLLLPCPRCQQVNKLVCSSYPLIVHRDHVISQEDFDDLNDRVRHYMDWSTNNMNYQTLKEVSQYIRQKKNN